MEGGGEEKGEREMERGETNERGKKMENIKSHSGKQREREREREGEREREREREREQRKKQMEREVEREIYNYAL